MGGGQSQAVNPRPMTSASDGSMSALTPGAPEKIQGLTRLLRAETRRKKDVERDEYDYTKENMQILKQMFKKMDPTVMKTSAQSTHGEIQLSFKYEVTKKLLLVKVIRCRDLSAKDLRGKVADPYVTLQLLPEVDGTHRVYSTKVAKKTLYPHYHEIFTFPFEEDMLIDGKMIFQVWDKDIMDQDDFIGEVIVHFNTFEFHREPLYTGWYTLLAETDLDICGEVEISLSYLMPSTLLVIVHRGENITNRHDGGESPNPFVKMQIPGVKGIHQTEVKYGTSNPVWEETFQFKVPPEEFDERYIVLHVVDHDDHDKNETLGQVIIDLNNFDPEIGFHGKFELADLKNCERLRSKWFQRATEQEFREALNAHAAFRTPKFLFQQHKGHKVIRVTSRKAGAQAKVHIMDGIPVF